MNRWALGGPADRWDGPLDALIERRIDRMDRRQASTRTIFYRRQKPTADLRLGSLYHSKVSAIDR